MKKHLFDIYHSIAGFKGISLTIRFLVMIITLGSGYAIALFPFVIYRSRYGKSNIMTRNHQAIHIQQQLEVGLVSIVLYTLSGVVLHSWIVAIPVLLLYYWIYLVLFIRELFIYGDSVIASHMIALNQEAIMHCNQSTYLGLRKPFAWIKYLKHCSISE